VSSGLLSKLDLGCCTIQVIHKIHDHIPFAVERFRKEVGALVVVVVDVAKTYKNETAITVTIREQSSISADLLLIKMHFSICK